MQKQPAATRLKDLPYWRGVRRTLELTALTAGAAIGSTAPGPESTRDLVGLVAVGTGILAAHSLYRVVRGYANDHPDGRLYRTLDFFADRPYAQKPI